MKKLKPEVREKLKKVILLIILVAASNFVDRLPDSIWFTVLKIGVYVGMAYLLIDLLRSFNNIDIK